MRNLLRAGLAAGVALSATVLGTLPASAYPVHPAGQRVKVTVAGGCPASVAKDVSVDNPGGGSVKHLVKRDPREVIICTYGADGATLRSSHVRGAGGAQRLARLTDRLDLALPKGIYNCPKDAGQVTIIAFAYKGDAANDLWYSPDGCATVDNGRIAAAQAGHPGFGSWSAYVDRLAR